MENEKIFEHGDRGGAGEFSPVLSELLPREPRTGLVAVSIVIAVISFIVMGNIFSDPATYQAIISSLDAKKDLVTGLMAASTGTSAAITLIPGDVGTPIAEKLIDLSADFMVVLAAIYLEKYLLTVFGFVAFRILIPLSCAVFIASEFAARRPLYRGVALRLSSKLFLFALMLVIVVPCSVMVSDMVDRTYQDSIDQTITAAQQTQDELGSLAQEGTGQQTEGEGKSTDLLSTITHLPETVSKLPETVSASVSDLTEQAEQSISNFVEALAVMIVTSCVIPLVVLAFFIWLMKTFLGIDMGPGASVSSLLNRAALTRRRG